MIFFVFLLDLMRSMTTTSKIAIKIITTMPKAATTPPKTFHWVPTKGCNHMHYIIPYWYYRDKFKMCITTHASGSKKDTIPNLKHAVVVVAGKTHLEPVALSATVLGHLCWRHSLFLSILLGRHTGTQWHLPHSGRNRCITHCKIYHKFYSKWNTDCCSSISGDSSTRFNWQGP